MSVFTRLLSFGVTKGLATLLVLVLSVIGGVRTGFDRLSPPLDEERSTLVLHHANTNGVKTATHGLIKPRQVSFFHVDANSSASRWNQDHLCAPSPLMGSAGGPRAPSVGA
jgi:hypothetical protein